MCSGTYPVVWLRLPGTCVGRRSPEGQPAWSEAHVNSSMCGGKLTVPLVIISA